jgi:two-component system cell cycle sensor histidine kinase/response regulator CckA
MTTASILIVEDQRVVARDIEEHLRRLGYSVVGVATSGEKAVQLAEELRPDLVLMDIRLEGAIDGVEAARQIRERFGRPVVYLTAYADEETLRRAKVTEPFGYVLKPFEERELRTVIEMALYKHQAERKLRESERRYADTLSSVGDAVIATDTAGRVTFLNPVAETLTGWPQREAVGRPLVEVFRIVSEETREPVESPAAKVLRTGTVVGLANHTGLLARDGRDLPIDDCGAPIIDDRGNIAGVVLVFHDVSEKRRAEKSLRESRERLRLAVQATGLGPWDWDLRTGAVEFSPEWKRQLGYEEHEVPGRYEEWEGRLHPDDRERVLDALRAYLDGRRPDYAVEFRLRHKDGSYRWIYTRAMALRDEGGKPSRMLGCHLDVTERKRAEQALVESHGLLNAVVEGTADAVFVKNLRGRYLMINSAGAGLLGRPATEILGKGDRELLPADAARAVVERDGQVMSSGRSQTLEETATVAGARRTYLTTRSALRDAQGEVIGLIGIARDVTELKRLEEQYLQAQKMEAVGRLAGGVAHDFNNLLTVINGYGEMVFGRLRADDPSHQLLAEVLKAGERASTLTRQLLAFSRKQVLQPQLVSLNALLGELVRLLQRVIGEDVELALVAGPGLGLTKVDPGQFEQAVINLAVNARDAMPQGGRLTIATRNAELAEGYVEGHPEVRPGRYLLVVVSDTGCGMDEATKAHLFEPFFTTKEQGKGTGLGLAMVYGFVKQSGGHVEVESEPGRGTAFKVYLPRAEEAAGPAKSSPDLHKMPKGTETVLLVEDEEAVRALSRLVLVSSGYTVLEARDGQEGVRVARQHTGPIHALVTDLVMPGMSGRQLAELLVRDRPDLRILFMSGYTDEAVMRQGVPESGFAFLQKPFSPLGLARKVREVLDATETLR